jgi:nephrocystin-3
LNAGKDLEIYQKSFPLPLPTDLSHSEKAQKGLFAGHILKLKKAQFMSQQPQSIRIFLSSTFRDMMPEREHLMKVIFPELRRRCLQKGLIFTEVDLRWGILEEESQAGKVIEICLSEIDKSRPYFIGILGERYGWVPGPEEYEKQASLIEAFPWVKEDIEKGLSITEMEIQYGVLRNPAMEGRAFFYLRESGKGTKDPEPLQALKQKIKAQDQHPVSSYASVEALGKQVLEDLWAEISARYPDEELPDAHQQERFQQQAWLREQQLFYLDYQHQLQQLDELLNKNSRVVVFAENGMGKSALLAAWTQQQQNASQRVLPYLIGSTPNSVKLEAMAAFNAREIQEKLEVPYPIPEKVEDPGALLKAFVGGIDSSESVTLLWDGLDQLQGNEGRMLNWLPRELPKGVRLLVSTGDPEQLKRLESQGFTPFSLSLLQPQDIKTLSEQFLATYSKKLPTDLLEKISQAPLSTHPVVLRSLLHELRLFGQHEALPEQVELLTRERDLPDFFEGYLKRLEQDFPSSQYQLDQVLVALSLARQGMTEAELLALSGLSPLRWSQLFNALEYHLNRQEGLLNLKHEFFRQAIFERYLPEAESLQQARQQLVRFFFSQLEALPPESDSRALQRITAELPDQLLELKDQQGIQQLLGSLAAFQALFEQRYELLGKLLGQLRELHVLADFFMPRLKNWLRAEEIPETRKVRLAYYLGHALMSHDKPVQALAFYEQALEAFQTEGSSSPLIRQALKEMASIYQQQGYLGDAIYLLTNLLGGEDEIGQAETFDALAQLYSEIGEFDKAFCMAQDALAFFRDRYGSQHLQVAILENNLGRIFDRNKDFEQAREHYEKALEISEALLGPKDPLSLRLRSNLAMLLMNAQKLEEARAQFMAVWEERKNLFGLAHPLTFKTTNSIGVCYQLGGAYSEADQWLRQAYEGQKKVLGASHPDTLVTLANLATLALEQEDFEQAERLQKRLFQHTQNTFGKVHERSIQAGMALAKTLSQQKKYPEAISCYQETIQAQDAFYGANNPMPLYTRYQLAQLRAEQGKPEQEDFDAFVNWYLYKGQEALEDSLMPEAAYYFKQVMEMCEEVKQGAHPAYFSALSSLADLHLRWHKYPEAAAYFAQIEAQAKAAMGADHPGRLQFLVLRAYALLKANQKEKALNLLYEMGSFHEQLLNFKPAFIRSLYQEMLIYFQEYQRVIENYEAHPEKANQLFDEIEEMLGELLKTDGTDPKRLKRADEMLEKAQQLSDTYGLTHPLAYRMKAHLLYQVEAWDQALAVLLQGLEYLARWEHEFTPASLSYRIEIADMYANFEQYTQALDTLYQAERVISLNPDVEASDVLQVYTNLALLHFQLSEGKDTAYHLKGVGQWLEKALPLAEAQKEADPETYANLKDLQDLISQ